MAFRIPAVLFSLCLVKKLTVKGIIGNTQGVNIIKLSGEEKVVSAIKIEDNFK